MAAPPTNFPPIQPSDLFLSVTHPLAQDALSAAMDAPPPDDGSQSQDRHSIPPPPLIPQSPRSAFAAFDPFPTLGSSNTPPPPAPDPPRGSRPSSRRSDSGGRSRSQNRRPIGGDSRSRSRSPSRDRSGSEGGDSEEDTAEPEYPWNPIIEDTSAPCEDELAYIEKKEENSALDEAYWRRHFFEEPHNGDEAFSQSTNLGDGRIILEIERFQGTKEQPNKELIIRSPVVKIGGYEWQVKFYPKGNGADWLSLYVECTDMLNSDFEEYEEFEKPSFPFLKGQAYSSNSSSSNFVKKRRTAAAQIGMVMYNPAEPRSNISGLEAHRYSKQCPDYGWPLFYQRYRLSERSHGERQPILRDDKLAFVAYIRVIDDPTSCLWGHDDSYNAFTESLLTTSLRPFGKQEAHLAALVPLLHFEHFRTFIKAQPASSKTVYQLQTILWKMYTRTASKGRERTRRQQEWDKRNTKTTDAVSCLKEICEALRKDCAGSEAAVNELLGTFDAEGAFIGSSKLKGPWIQPEVRRADKPVATPAILTIELKRQDFDAEERKWKKLTDRITVDQHLVVAGKKYSLFSFLTHCGDLQSNRHNVYVRPSCIDGETWLAYTDGKVTAMTDMQALAPCEGGARKRRDSPFSGPRSVEDAEVIYAAIYIRDDCVSGALPREEVWDNVPEGIREGREFERQANGSLAKPRPGSEPDMPLREEQDRFLQYDAGEAGRALTPDWPSMIVDADGDVVMSDSEDDTPLFDVDGKRLDTKPSRSRKWYGKIDALGQDFYEGCMLGSQYHGEGHLITMAGDEYTGSFYHGRQAGYGKMVYAQTGNIYEGQWERGKQHGQGKLTEAATGSVFEGGFEDGKKKGAFVLKGTLGGGEEDLSALCSVCYEREMNTAFYDCGHVTCCKQCADKVSFCPVCRRSVVARLQIYGVKMTLE